MKHQKVIVTANYFLWQETKEDQTQKINFSNISIVYDRLDSIEIHQRPKKVKTSPCSYSTYRKLLTFEPITIKKTDCRLLIEKLIEKCFLTTKSLPATQSKKSFTNNKNQLNLF